MRAGYCYVARKPCGCLRGVVVVERGFEDEAFETAEQWFAEGEVITPSLVEHARVAPLLCGSHADRGAA